MSQSCPITPGCEVTLHLALSSTDGIEAISTFGGEPSTLTMGDGTLLEGLELALYGLKSGDRQNLTLSPHQAFGAWDETKLHRLPRADFAAEMELEKGLLIAFDTAENEELAGIVTEVGETEVMVDFNHPLAGREVAFRVEILQVNPPVSNQGE